MLIGILVAALFGLGITLLANLATSVYLHRCLAHRAVTLRAPVRFVMRVFLWLSTGIRPRQWAAVHRKHHAWTDTEDDPHSPAQLGWQRVLFTNAALYRRVAADEATVERYAKDIPQTRLDRILLDRALVGLAVGFVILVLLLGWQLALIAAAVHMVSYLGLGGAVNGIAHTFGKRPFENSATNVHWIAWLTAGEGFHNNHHAAPTSARFSRRWYEADWGWWLIKGLAKVHLATIRHADVDALAARAAAARSDRTPAIAG